MNETLIVQPIFCPTKRMLGVQLKSMLSLHRYMQQYPMRADICFAGFVDRDYYDELVANINKLFGRKSCILLRFNKNYGKAYVVNEAIKRVLQQTNNYQYLLTFDSDICFETNQPNLLQRLIDTSEKASKVLDKPFGLIACNFTGDNLHWSDKFENRKQAGDEFIIWPTDPAGGIAGGCIFVSIDTWLKVGGYRVVGVYAPDDGYLMLDVYEAGYFICVLETLFVHHPGSFDDPHYQIWKERTMQKFTRRLMESKNQQFAPDMLRDIADCDDFWKQAKFNEDGGNCW